MKTAEPQRLPRMPLSLRINVQACRSLANGRTRLFTPAGLVLIAMSEVERERERGCRDER